MPLTQDHLDRAVLRGDERFKRWKTRFGNQWNYTQNQVQLALFWQSLPPIVKQQLQNIDPVSTREMEKKFGGKHGR